MALKPTTKFSGRLPKVCVYRFYRISIRNTREMKISLNVHIMTHYFLRIQKRGPAF